MHNLFCREPGAGKPHAGICAGVRLVRGVSTHQEQYTENGLILIAHLSGDSYNFSIIVPGREEKTKISYGLLFSWRVRESNSRI